MFSTRIFSLIFLVPFWNGIATIKQCAFLRSLPLSILFIYMTFGHKYHSVRFLPLSLHLIIPQIHVHSSCKCNETRMNLLKFLYQMKNVAKFKYCKSHFYGYSSESMEKQWDHHPKMKRSFTLCEEKIVFFPVCMCVKIILSGCFGVFVSE